MKNKTKIVSIVLFFLIFITLVSCKKQETDWKGKTEIVDGVKVVHNFQSDQNEKFKPIKFVEDLFIGIEEGNENYMFNYPVDIDSDSLGNIYVLDWGDSTIRKYDSHGLHIKNIGRKGEGPGELQSPRYLCISDQGNIYVDKGRNQIEIFDLSGEYQRTLKFINKDQFSVNKNEELIIGYRSYQEGEHNEVKIVYKVGKYDSLKNEIVEFYNQEQHRQARISDGTFTFEYPLFVKWDINSANNIHIATANRYEIDVFSSSGQLLFKYKLDFNPIPVMGEAQSKISEIIDKLRGLIDVKAISELVKYYPVFKSISIDEKDRIWIEHYKAYWRDKPRKETIFDVFFSDGKYLFTTKIKGNVFPQPVFKNGYIYTLFMDESGFSRALRLRIEEN